MRKVAKILLTALTATAMFAAPMAQAETDGSIIDPAGDANGSGTFDEFINIYTSDAPSLPSGGYSYGPADLRKVWLSTDFIADTDEAGNRYNRPTGITAHFLMEQPFDQAGYNVEFNLETDDGTCSTKIGADLEGDSDLSADGSGATWSIDDHCPGAIPASDPTALGGTTTYSSSDWAIGTSGKEVTISIPFDSLEEWQLALIAPGTTISSFSAVTQVNIFFYPFMDGTRPTGHFTVGADIPTP